MSQFKVIVTDYVFESFEIEKEILGKVDAELEVHQCKSADELRPFLAGAHAILNTYLPGMDREVFASAPELKIIVRYGIGIDTIDIAEATRRGILVVNVPDYCVNEVADHALSHFLCLARKIALSDRRVRAGEWSLSYVKPLARISEMTAGIIGFGRIGRAIARRLRAFGATIIFFDPFAPPEVDGCHSVNLDQLYETSDAVFVQCPSNEETHHLISRQAFEKMTRRPILVNCARGAIVDTDAVAWALENDKISGAGLDLLEDEDAVVKQEHPLKQFENVILTPHSAWYSESAIQSLQRKAAEEVVRGLTGQRPLSLVNPDVLEGS